nr:MAG TPA: hypothetical protein [Caudoviricetes sp.]
MARYLVMKRDNDVRVVKEEVSEVVSLSFGDFIEELASPHYERYDVRSIDYWDVNEENDDIESFGCLWNFYGYSVDDFVRLFNSHDASDGVDLA